MKVTRSAIHRLEVEVKCGCKAAGEYEDAACKKQRGVTSFIPCDTHKSVPGVEMMETMFIELVDKEALALVIEPAVHPRTLALVQQQAEDGGAIQGEDSNPAAPARTLRVAGSSGAVRAQSAPVRAAPGSHRPNGGGGGTASPFRRSDPTTRLSPAAQSRIGAGSKVASAKAVGGHINPSGISFDGEMEMDMGEVAEDTRVTRLLHVTNALGDAEDDPSLDDDFEL